MPERYLPVRPHPSKPFYSLGEAAQLNQLLVVKCSLCHRCLHFLASDLAAIYGPKHPVHLPPFKCARCETNEFLSIKTRSIQVGDVGRLPVRRPGKVVQVQKWRSVMLGDP